MISFRSLALNIQRSKGPNLKNSPTSEVENEMVHTMHAYSILTYLNVVHFLLENCCDTVRAPSSN